MSNVSERLRASNRKAHRRRPTHENKLATTMHTTDIAKKAKSLSSMWLFNCQGCFNTDTGTEKHNSLTFIPKRPATRVPTPMPIVQMETCNVARQNRDG